MKVALLGPEGTYTHQAADKYFENLEPVYCSNIGEIFGSDVEVKFIPVENSLGGGVADTIDFLHEGGESITAEVQLKIEHALISQEEIKDIERIVSHPQALAQCRDLIGEYGWEEAEADSTSSAVENLSDGEAALASKIAAELNGVSVLKKSVQDTDSNTTRFFVLNGPEEEGEKTSMILEPGEDRPGLLHSMLSCFAGHQINLSHIQSRPTKKELGDYFFYIEAETGKGEKLDRTLQCLDTYADVQILGSYPVIEDA